MFNNVQIITAIYLVYEFSIYFKDKTRGFGFVEFEQEEDCAEALENMHGAELFGKVLRCSIAKPMANVNKGQAVWTSEDWILNHMNSEGDENNDFEGIDKIEIESLNPTNQ